MVDYLMPSLVSIQASNGGAVYAGGAADSASTPACFVIVRSSNITFVENQAQVGGMKRNRILWRDIGSILGGVTSQICHLGTESSASVIEDKQWMPESITDGKVRKGAVKGGFASV